MNVYNNGPVNILYTRCVRCCVPHLSLNNALKNSYLANRFTRIISSSRRDIINALAERALRSSAQKGSRAGPRVSSRERLFSPFVAACKKRKKKAAWNYKWCFSFVVITVVINFVINSRVVFAPSSIFFGRIPVCWHSVSSVRRTLLLVNFVVNNSDFTLSSSSEVNKI